MLIKVVFSTAALLTVVAICGLIAASSLPWFMNFFLGALALLCVMLAAVMSSC